MFWFYAGLIYVAAHLLGGWLLGNAAELRTLFGNLALIAASLVPPAVILRRRRAWRGAQAVFWTTIAIGALAWAIGQIGWTVHEVLFDEPLPWLRWNALLNLVGSAMPLVALHARPYRGARRADAPIIAVDIAGLATIAAFFDLFFVIGPGMVEATPGGPPTLLMHVSQAQRLLLLAGMLAALAGSRGTPWAPTFQKLALAAAIGFVGRVMLNAAITRGDYYTGAPFDLAWALPFLLYAWAAATAPESPAAQDGEVELTFSSAPWLIFAVVAAVPATAFVVGSLSQPSPRLEALRGIVSTVAWFALLGLLAMRVAVERAARRRTLASLRLMAAAVQQTDDLTLILRDDNRVEYANTAFCRAVGYSRPELDRMPAEALVASDSQATFADIANRVRRGGVGRGMLTRVRKDGSTFVTAVTVVPLTGARGELTHFVDIERDITDELKRRDQLIHAERLAAVGQLVSGVAHEINNPLQTIIGFTEIMLGTEHRPESRRDLERIFTEANRAGKIVRNLLAFVRRSSHARTQDDLNDIVQSTVSLRAYELRVAGIELVEHYDHTLPAVFVNREEVQQVVLNLVLNAEHAMLDAHGRGRLTISTGRAGDRLYVDVEDDGPGVPAALAGQIFEPFFTTKEVGKGTGLGLSIGMGIAASHGGRLELLAAAGRGARFRLTLPAVDAAARTSAEPVEGTVVSLPEPGRVALVADDEPAVRDLLTRLLERRGYAVDAAEDGDQALELAAHSEYDLVLCDVKMPHMGGAELYRRLADVAPMLREQFVFITGDSVPGDVSELAASERIPLLSKPFTSADLDRVLAHVDPQPSGESAPR